MLNDVPEPKSWLSFFHARRRRSVDLRWSEDVPLGESERDLIARAVPRRAARSFHQGAWNCLFWLRSGPKPNKLERRTP
jgi:hypothetical protein